MESVNKAAVEGQTWIEYDIKAGLDPEKVFHLPLCDFLRPLLAPPGREMAQLQVGFHVVFDDGTARDVEVTARLLDVVSPVSIISGDKTNDETAEDGGGDP